MKRPTADGRAVAEWRVQVTYHSGATKILRRSTSYETLRKRLRFLEMNPQHAPGSTYAIVPHRYAGSSEYENCGWDSSQRERFAINHEEFAKPMQQRISL